MSLSLTQFKKTVATRKRKLVLFLKKFDEITVPGLSAMVKKADKEVWNKIDCMDCANCCKTMTPTYKKEDISRIADHLNMKPKEFKERWLLQEKKSGDWVNKSTPCQFLVKNKCSIYDVRPKDCAGFPHHHKKDFELYNDTYIQNLSSCPATLMLVERLQEKIEEEYIWK
jgi:Fe-S-cluster containining protein